MAAIGKIRSWGPWLVGIIGLALFGFIATDFTRSCEATSNQARMKVGEVMGEKLAYQDFDNNVKELKNVYEVFKDAYARMGQVMPDVDEETLRDQVWQNYVNNTIIANEAEKLGLGVTDKEMEIILKDGTHPAFGEVPVLPFFVNGGKFDANLAKQYKAAIEQQRQQYPDLYERYDMYWKTFEKMLREAVLAHKYYGVLQACLLSNESSAKIAFDGKNDVSSIEIATLAYSSISDNEVKVDDKDLAAKYEANKEMFKWNTETRDVKFVVCTVVPSDEDNANLRNDIEEARKELMADSLSVSDILGMHQSKVAYLGADKPYNASSLKNLSPNLFAALDSMNSDMTVTEPFNFVNPGSDVMNIAVARLNRAYDGVDSVSYDFVSLPILESESSTKKMADSLVAVIKGGVSIDSVARSVNGASASARQGWVSRDMYHNTNGFTADAEALYNAVMDATPGEPKQVTILNAQRPEVRLFVVKERHTAKLYDVVIVSKEIRYSPDTEEKAYNNFSQFVSSCSDVASLEKKASGLGYQVYEQRNLKSDAANLGGTDRRSMMMGIPSIPEISNSRKSVKWAFADAQENSISTIEHNPAEGIFYVVAVTKVHPVGYLDQKSVEDYLRQEVIKDKKADLLIKKLGGNNTIEGAQAAGAFVDNISQITFPSPVTFSGNRLTENGLSGAVAATALGQTVKSPVKGKYGVYVFKVTDRKATSETPMNRRVQENQLIFNSFRVIGSRSGQNERLNIIQDVLREKAKVEDNRFRF